MRNRRTAPGSIEASLKLDGRDADFSRVREVRRKAWIGLTVLATLVVLAPPVLAGPPEELQLLALTNASRVTAGLAPLALEPDLVDFARAHSADMLARGDVFHSGREARLASAPSGWRLLGENVGAGTSPERLHAAFMESSGHRANILGDFDHVAVGAVRSQSGRLYVTLVFVKLPELASRPVRIAAMPDPATSAAGSMTAVIGLVAGDVARRD